MERAYLNTKDEPFIFENQGNDSNIFKKENDGKFYFFKCSVCGLIKERAIYFRKGSLQYSFTCSSCNRKATNLKRFGVENPYQSTEIKNKIKQTTVTKYGVTNVNKLKSVRDKITAAREPHKKEIAEKISKALKGSYDGQKSRKTKLKKYGAVFVNREKQRKTMTELYGAPFAQQVEEFHRASIKCFVYTDGEKFNSSWELAYYIWLKDNEISFEHEPFVDEFRFEENGKIRHYTPDFRVGSVYIEIKGDQFFDKDGKLYNPFTKTHLTELESFMKEKGIVVLKGEDVKPYIEYVNKKYGTNYLNFFSQANSNVDVSEGSTTIPKGSTLQADR